MSEELRPAFELASFVAPTIAAAVFIVAMSAVREPTRQRFNAVGAAGFATLYLNGGYGLWEFLYMSIAVFPAYLGLRSYTWIGVAWFMHSAWDLVHHLYGNTLWHWAPSSSFGCFVMDALVAIWFFAGAPSVFEALRSKAPLSRGGSI